MLQKLLQQKKAKEQTKTAVLSFGQERLWFLHQLDSANAAYIKSQITAKIRATSVTIVLLGPTTNRSTWVTWEINKAVELGKKVFGVRLYSDRSCPTPTALASTRGTVLDWNIAAIVREIG